MARKIKLMDGSFQSIKFIIKDAIITQVKFTAKFDQLVADCMEIKETFYDSNGHLRRGNRKWELETMLWGATVNIAATQQDLFTGNSGLEIKSIQLSNGWVRRLRADETLRISFMVSIADIPRELFDYVEGVKKGTLNIVIEPASESEAKNALVKAGDLGLFKIPKEAESTEPAEGETIETPVKADTEDEPVPAEELPPDLRGPALATYKEVLGNKKKRTAARPN